jgi:hypothetical protein
MADPDNADEDTYSDFAHLYGRFSKLEAALSRRVTEATRSNDVTEQLPSGAPLTILLKELDHIQAILARYDTFFFLMKQLCATAVFISIGEFLKHETSTAKLSIPFWAVAGIPFFFLIVEYCFRLFHWSGYISRLKLVRASMKKGTTPERMYVIKETRDACESVKPFDFVFYGLILLIVLFTYFALGVR